MSKSNTDITIIPAGSIPAQRWWPQLHTAIIEAFRNKNYSVYPPTWTRLNTDPEKGATGLMEELGDDGHLAVIFAENGVPVACGGVLPYRGDNWINETSHESDQIANLPTSNVENVSADTPDWEICCFCVHPSYRSRGLSKQLIEASIAFIKPKGAKRLFSNYAVDETGTFWPLLGFEEVVGGGGLLLKGFKVDPTKEGLRADVHFKMGVKTL